MTNFEKKKNDYLEKMEYVLSANKFSIKATVESAIDLIIESRFSKLLFEGKVLFHQMPSDLRAMEIYIHNPNRIDLDSNMILEDVKKNLVEIYYTNCLNIELKCDIKNCHYIIISILSISVVEGN